MYQIGQGIYDVIEITSEMLLPQEINHQLIGAIDFKKGCYTGQEIIARLHYKGLLKKQLKRITITSPNDQIFNLTLQEGESCSDTDTLKLIKSKDIDLGQILIIVKVKEDLLVGLSIVKSERSEDANASHLEAETIEKNLEYSTKISLSPLSYAIPKR